MSGFSPSVNRTVLAGLPDLPAGVAGTRAQDGLASWSVARLVRQRLNPSGLPPLPDEPGPEFTAACAAYPPVLSALVEREDPRALALAGDLGTVLAALLATLHLGPADARAARPDWPPEQWARWGRVRRVGVGGGLMRGALGERMVGSARGWLPRLGAGKVRVFQAERPHLLPLLGAVGLLPDGPAVLMDAGHTAVKRARAVVEGGRALALEEAPALPAPHGLPPLALATFLADAAADLAPPGRAPLHLGLSLATYTDPAGQPLPGQAGLYGSLGGMPLAATLMECLERRLRGPALVCVIHDGTAAVRALAGRADAALVLGTSLGSGLAEVRGAER